MPGAAHALTLGQHEPKQPVSCLRMVEVAEEEEEEGKKKEGGEQKANQRRRGLQIHEEKHRLQRDLLTLFHFTPYHAPSISLAFLSLLLR